MKNGKKATARERMHIESFRLKSENWLISKKTSDGWLIVNKFTNRTKEIPAP